MVICNDDDDEHDGNNYSDWQNIGDEDDDEDHDANKAERQFLT